jgi:hypothetical protein
MNERMAPGHVYQHRLGTGIQWQPGVVKLWEGGYVTAEAPHTAKSSYEFWYNLAFADCFPEITHWWFRSAWTQKVRLTSLQGLLGDGSALGLMQFVDEHTPAGLYTITETEPPVIAVPYPPNEVQPVNLPLRLALSRLVAGIITGEAIPDQWVLVTSLVPKDQLELVFPTIRDTTPWQLEAIDTPIREVLCLLQGLER